MPTIQTATLEDLSRHGDFAVTNSGSEVIIDLTVNRSGCTLYGSGSTLGAALSDIWRTLEEHLDAVDHVEDLGINPNELGRLVDAPDPRDSDLYATPALSAAPVAPVVAAAGEPVDVASPGYVMALLIPVRIGRA